MKKASNNVGERCALSRDVRARLKTGSYITVTVAFLLHARERDALGN